MARLPMYEQQTAFNAPRADASAFGGGTSQAVAQAGGAAFDLGVQMKRREDVIDRVQRLNEFDQYAQEALTAVNDTDDIAKKATVDSLAQGLQQRANEIMGQHAGTAASRAELQAQLNNQVGQYVKSATAAQVKAQQQFIGRAVEQKVNVLSQKAAMAPEMLPFIFESLDQDINTYADAMSPEQQAAYKEAGRSAVTVGAIDKLLQSGNHTAAKGLMSNPEVTKYLDRNAARRFNIDIAVEERKGELEVKRREDNVKRFTQLVRRDLTPAERQRVYDLPEKKNMTVADKITEYEIVTGRPVSQSVVDEFYNVDAGGVSGGIFGNSLQGRALNFVTENAAAYAAGLLSPEKRAQFDAFAAEAYKPVTRANPATGLMETTQPNIPQFVKEAMSTRGVQQAAQAAPAPGQRVRLTDATGRVVGEATVGANGAWTINGQPGASWSSETPAAGTSQPTASTTTPSNAQGIPSAPQSGGDAGRTIWERRGNIAGPVAAGASAVSRVPGIGPTVAGAVMGDEQVRQMEVDRTFVENASRNLIRVLQNNPQFAEGERKALEKELSIGPEIFRSAESYEAKLIGVAQSLTKRKMDAERSLTSGAISLDERKRAMDNIQAIDNFMRNLGIPPVVSTEEEVQTLPPGTVFMDAAGKEYRKR